MLKQLADWIDDRTGYRALVRTFSDEIIPGGARWRYIFGSALASIFLIQAFTGHADDDGVQPVDGDGLGKRLLHQSCDVDGLVHPRAAPLRRAGGDGAAASCT